MPLTIKKNSSKILRINEKLLETFREIFFSKSLELIIFPTEQCNFRCIYCYENFKNLYIQPYVIEGIKNLILKSKAEFLYLSFFGGEPLLGFRYIQRIIDLVNHLKINYSGSMTTNGFLLSKQYFTYLVTNKVTFFQITLDGTKDYHNNQRNLTKKIDTFSVIYKNIVSTKDTKMNFKILIRINVTQENYQSIPELLQTLSKDFNRDERYEIIIHEVRDWGGYGQKNIKDKKINLVTKKEVFSLYKYAKDLGLNIFKKNTQKQGSVCYAGKPNSFIIRSDGRTQKCTIALEEDFNTIGYINTHGEFFIDNEKHKLWYQKNAMNEEKCKKCSFVDNCFGLSCPLQTIKNNKIPCCDYKINFDFYQSYILK